MAILEPIEKESASNNSLSKVIDSGAQDIVFEILQKHQYQYPVKSTVREIASNCLDAIKEKNIAIKILTDQAKVEDFFIERPEYPDSNFNRDYYSLTYLSPIGEDDNVLIEYKDGNLDRDTISFTDNGVGLWGQRLLGYFNLGYSTKRNWANGIGKWGLGAKSPLATNILSFRIITRYNGLETEFDIYDNDIVPVVPKFDLALNQENHLVQIPILDKNKNQVIDASGNPIFFEFYARATTSYNGTTTIIPVKKHVKQEYLSAVRSQLMYFDNIRLIIHDNNVESEEVLASPIIYETEDFVLSDNNIYTRPHLVINGINYNDIDFNELEIEQRRGNIGIKVKAEDVDVTPSRESVIWNLKTRNTVLKRLETVREDAMKLILKQFSEEEDYIGWLIKVKAFRSNMSKENNQDLTIISRLSNIIDLKEEQLPFRVEGLSYHNDISIAFPGFNIRRFTRIWDGSKYVTHKEKCTSVSEVNFNHLYLKTAKSNPKINKTILDEIYNYNPDAFTVAFYVLEPIIQVGFENFNIEDYREAVRPRLKAIMESPLLKMYSDVPEATEAEVEDAEVLKTPLTPAEERELNGAILIHDIHLGSTDSFGHSTYLNKTKTTIKAKILKEFKGLILYCYGTTDEMNLLGEMDKLLAAHFAKRITVGYGIPSFKVSFKVYDPQTQLSTEHFEIDQLNDPRFSDAYMTIMVSKENSKHLVNNGIYVKDFLIQFKNNHLTMSHYLVQWNTARHIHDKLIKRFKFINSLSHFNKNLSAIAEELQEYANKYYSKFPLSDKFEEEFVSHTDSLLELQLFIEEHKTQPDAIAAKSLEIFNAQATKASAVDLDLYLKLNELIERLAPIEHMFNDSKALEYFTAPKNELLDEYYKYCKLVGFEIALD